MAGRGWTTVGKGCSCLLELLVQERCPNPNLCSGPSQHCTNPGWGLGPSPALLAAASLVAPLQCAIKGTHWLCTMLQRSLSSFCITLSSGEALAELVLPE